jgi:hypothetical protein
VGGYLRGREAYRPAQMQAGSSKFWEHLENLQIFYLGFSYLLGV